MRKAKHKGAQRLVMRACILQCPTIHRLASQVSVSTLRHICNAYGSAVNNHDGVKKNLDHALGAVVSECDYRKKKLLRCKESCDAENVCQKWLCCYTWKRTMEV